MSNLLYYSKYATVFERDGVYAYYHSLRLRPLYINEKFHKLVQSLIEVKDVEKITEKLLMEDATTFRQLVEGLVDLKIFSTSLEFDEKIIKRFRNSLPKPYIQIAYFVMTENCNLACSYCFIVNKMDKGSKYEKVMTKETVKNGLDFFCRQINRQPEHFEEEKTIIIYGGEPLINYKKVQYLICLIKEYKKQGKLPEKTNVSMITNGTLISEEKARYLKQENVSIAISLDGIDANSNSCRKLVDGSPAFDNIINGIKIAQEEGCNCGLSMTLTEETIKDFSKIQDVVQEFGINSLGFNILMTDETFQVAEDYNQKASDFILKGFEFFREKGIYEDRIMRKVKSFVDGKIYLYDCGALGGNQIVIAPNGDVGICHGYLHNREYFVTNLNEEGFNPETDETYLEWNRRTPICMEQCQDCEALGICGGGCPANAKDNGENRSIWDLDERFCVHAKKTLQWLIWDLYDKTIK